MPVYIYEEDAFEKMVAVEGETWRRHVKNFGEWGFQAFLDAWNELKPEIEEERKQPGWEENLKDFGISTEGGGSAIYGAGGYNGYMVTYDGEIIFLRMMAGTAAAIPKAEAQGFRIR